MIKSLVAHVCVCCPIDTAGGTLVNTIRRSEWYAVAFYHQVQKVRMLHIHFHVHRHLPSAPPSVLIHGLNAKSSANQLTVQHLQQLLHLTDVKRPTDFIGPVGGGSTALKCFFHFEIPQYLNCELLGENRGGYLRDLPASFSAPERPNRRAVLQDRCEGDCMISYKVLVRALRRRQVIASTVKNVKLVPSSESRPPVCVADFPNEYALAKSRGIRSGFLGLQREGEMRLEAAEPVSLILSHVTDRVFLPVSLTLTHTIHHSSRRGACRDDEPADVASGVCTAALISSTFISSVPRQSVPTLPEVSNSTSLGRKINVCAKAKVAVQFSKWQASSLTLHGSSPRSCPSIPPSITTDQPLPPLPDETSSQTTQQHITSTLMTLSFPNDDSYLVPTFESSLVSRRYKLALDVHISKPHRAHFRLTLPVQISYQKDRAQRTPNRAGSHGDDDDDTDPDADPWGLLCAVESPPYVS